MSETDTIVCGAEGALFRGQGDDWRDLSIPGKSFYQVALWRGRILIAGGLLEFDGAAGQNMHAILKMRAIDSAAGRCHHVTMYTRTDLAYLQARAIKRKEHVLAAPHNALLDAFGEVLGVRPLDFSLDAWETTVGYRQQLVGVILERVGDCTRVGTKVNDRRVAELFLGYVAGHHAAGDRTKQRVHPAVGGVFPEVIVAFWALESIEAQIANAKVDPEAIAAQFEDVVSIQTSGIVRTVWFETDAALAAARSAGITEAICAAFVDAVREHDEFGWFGPQSVDVRFDTRQNVAENYGGQDWMYYR